MNKILNLHLVKGVIFLALMTASAEVQAQLPTVQEVLDNWAQALGGRQVIDSVQSMETSASITMFGMEGTIQQKMAHPNNYVMELELGGIFSVTNLAIEGRTWSKDQNGHVAEVGGQEKADLINSVFLENLNHLRSGADASIITNLELDQESGLVKVTMAPSEGSVTVFFLDRNTWLPVRSESDAGAGDTMVVSYLEWERFQGLLFASKFHQSSGVAQNDLNLTLNSVVLNPVWSTDPFGPLAEAKTASAVQDPQAAGSIPMTLRGVHIFVEVMVNGQGPFQFIFDTGAGITVLDKGLAESLGLNIQGELAGRGVGEGTPDFALATGVTLGMPGIEVPDQTVATLDIRNLLEKRIGSQVDGILGFGFISRFVTEIDYAGHRLGLHDPGTFNYQGEGVIVPMEMDGSTPHVRATIRGYGSEPVTGYFLLDTGSGNAMSLAGPFARTNELQATMPQTVKHSGGFGVGGETTTVFGRLQSFELGGLVFSEPFASIGVEEKGAAAETNSAGLIGGRLLSRCRVFLDYPGNKLILEPNKNFADRFHWDKSGLTLITGGRGAFNNFRIAHIVEDSPGQKAGLREGDELMEVGGRPADQWTLDALSELFRGKDQDLKIIIRREGETKRLTLKLRDIV
jgi:hypothetical protein